VKVRGKVMVEKSDEKAAGRRPAAHASAASERQWLGRF
jgi:hypothetical protein